MVTGDSQDDDVSISREETEHLFSNTLHPLSPLSLPAQHLNILLPLRQLFFQLHLNPPISRIICVKASSGMGAMVRNASWCHLFPESEAASLRPNPGDPIIPP